MMKSSLLASRIFFSIFRHASSWKSTVLRYSEYGDPEKVLQLATETVSRELLASEVALRILASPINPANINTIQGVYAIKPKLPAVGGSEAVGEVIEVGSSVKNLAAGDRVIPCTVDLGTWRNYMILSEDELIKVPKDIPITTAATVTVNPCTAYRMLHDFTGLWKGDVIIQNGANSAVGQAVIQIAAAKGWRTINIIRDRPNAADTAKQLVDLGASYVITDADFKRSNILQDLPKARLGFNCVGGKAVSDILKLMDEGSTLVTYGGMSKLPMIVPTAAMIFKDVLLCGFWMTKWVKEHSMEERTAMLDELYELTRAGKLKPPVLEPVFLEDYKSAVQQAQEGYTGKKFMFVMDKEVFDRVQKNVSNLK